MATGRSIALVEMLISKVKASMAIDAARGNPRHRLAAGASYWLCAECAQS